MRQFINSRVIPTSRLCEGGSILHGQNDMLLHPLLNPHPKHVSHKPALITLLPQRHSAAIRSMRTTRRMTSRVSSAATSVWPGTYEYSRTGACLVLLTLPTFTSSTVCSGDSRHRRRQRALPVAAEACALATALQSRPQTSPYATARFAQMPVLSPSTTDNLVRPPQLLFLQEKAQRREELKHKAALPVSHVCWRSRRDEGSEII
jgi:hypothetical protein